MQLSTTMFYRQPATSASDSVMEMWISLSMAEKVTLNLNIRQVSELWSQLSNLEKYNCCKMGARFLAVCR
jgi:hypothetical protein